MFIYTWANICAYRLNFAATGTLNGDVCIWDLASHSQRLSCKHKVTELSAG